MIVRPSYHQGFARSAGESKQPGRWKNLVGAWYATLGVTGGTLFDVSPHKRHGAINTPSNRWIITPDGYGIQPNAPTTAEINIAPPSPMSQFTYVAGIVCGASASFKAILGDSGAHSCYISSNKIVYYNGGAKLTGNTTLVEGQEYVIALKVDEDNNVSECFVDGVSDGTGTGGSNPTFEPLQLCANGGNGEDYNGVLKWLVLYDDYLPSAEIIQFQRDPFGLIELADLPIGFVAGAPPAGRIMSSLTNHGGLAGRGGIAGQGGGLAG
ncbi:MAG: hypothetical protein KAR06_01695 [Deltaproteobacteria bacterium]|nr:hypothetical protein [Deltaproteobacteria bacterium]